MTNRRDLLLTGLGLAGVAAGWQLWIAREQPFDFADMTELPGWRRLDTGQVTQPGTTTFLTIGQDNDPVPTMAVDALDAALYRTPGTPRIAVFADFFCPFCRILTSRLAKRPDLPVTWHELPLLGPASEIAAKASVAADLQGRYTDFVEALARSNFRPTAAHMGRVAEGIGLNGAELVRDMTGDAVASRLALSRGAAATLGVYGTPALTIGRTLVMGEITTDELDRLIALETA